uniref:hypothetical protein n=1 Tax=Edaphosphingomonas laterariae TaxID=861865 RepID=UPI001181B311|nr:hypothetical protein [Sphingomonas laterariae]
MAKAPDFLWDVANDDYPPAAASAVSADADISADQWEQLKAGMVLLHPRARVALERARLAGMRPEWLFAALVADHGDPKCRRASFLFRQPGGEGRGDFHT